MVSNRPHVYSGPWCFQFNVEKNIFGYVLPEWTEPDGGGLGQCKRKCCKAAASRTGVHGAWHVSRHFRLFREKCTRAPARAARRRGRGGGREEAEEAVESVSKKKHCSMALFGGTER